MSYGLPHHGPTRRTAPLIQRPSARAAAAPPLDSTVPIAAAQPPYAQAGYHAQPQGHYNPAFAAAHAFGAYQQHYPYPNQLGHSFPPPQHPYPAAQYGGPQAYNAHYLASGLAGAGAGAGQGGAYTDSVPGPSRLEAQPPSMYPPRVPAAPSSSTAHTAHGLPARPAVNMYPDPSSSRPVPSSSSTPNPPGPSPHGRSRNPRTNGGGGPASRGPDLVQCSQADCTYSGTRKQVREHEEDRHLIYAPGREPKPWSGSLKPLEGAVIEGTGISLDTPEAVARWIQERKKRWPSNKVVEEKEKARAERIAAGLEAPPRERDGGRGRGRGGRGRGGGGLGHADFAARDAGVAREDLPGAGRSAAGTTTEAGGESAVKRVKLEDGSAAAVTAPPAVRKYGDDRDYDDASAEEEEDDDGAPEQASAKPGVANQDGALAAVSDQDRSDISALAQTASQTNGSAAPDGSGPEQAQSAGEPQKRFQVVCRHWRRGNCALGDTECPYLHHLPPNAGPPPPPKRRRPAPAPAPHNPFARPAGFSDPFSLVEERDYRHTVADVLQVIEFLGANDWLRGVEIRRGQVDEESGIEVLQESEEGTKPLLKGLSGDTGVGSVACSAAIVELATAPASDRDAAEASSTSAAEPLQPADAADSLPSPFTVPALSTSLPPATSKPPAAGLFADYGSDSDDDEADEQAVASALMAGA